MNNFNRIFAPLQLIASDYFSCLHEGDRPMSQVADIQTPESRDWYLKRAEEKRKRKAKKLKEVLKCRLNFPKKLKTTTGYI